MLPIDGTQRRQVEDRQGDEPHGHADEDRHLVVALRRRRPTGRGHAELLDARCGCRRCRATSAAAVTGLRSGRSAPAGGVVRLWRDGRRCEGLTFLVARTTGVCPVGRPALPWRTGSRDEPRLGRRRLLQVGDVEIVEGEELVLGLAVAVVGGQGAELPLPSPSIRSDDRGVVPRCRAGRGSGATSRRRRPTRPGCPLRPARR